MLTEIEKSLTLKSVGLHTSRRHRKVRQTIEVVDGFLKPKLIPSKDGKAILTVGAGWLIENARS